MPWVVREAVRDINRAVGRRWQAIDPLLPDPATLPAGCGEPLVVPGDNGRAAGLGVCVHQHIGPDSLNQTWGAAERFTLVPRLPGQDVAPLATEVNQLIDANREIVERARTQVGNLAHALKTPLSVLMNEADAMSPILSEKVREQAEIMRRQVTFYLDRARAAARARTFGLATEVKPVVEGLVRTYEKLHDDRALTFDVELQPNLRFRGEAQDLTDLIGNLLDNAGKWARERVAIRAARAAGGDQDPAPFLVAQIDDDGPGLDKSARAAAVERGKRLDESRPGSGLGLSIVVDLASIYGGSLELDESPLGGLRAILRLPCV